MKSKYVAVMLAIMFGAQALAVAAPPIKIGGLFDLTGKAQNIGVATRDVAQMVVDRINRKGGVNGSMIQLIQFLQFFE